MLTLLVTTLAYADVAPIEPPGKHFVSHSLRVEGMGDHPGHVLVVYDAPQDGQISANLAYHSEGQSEQVLADGSRSRGNLFSRPTVYLMTRDNYNAWSKISTAEIERQRIACAERGEGCMHISRFVPHYAPPTNAIDCKMQLEAITLLPDSGPDRIVDVFRLKTASADTCLLENQGRESFRNNKPYKARGCSTVHGLAAGIWLASVGFVVVNGRRQRQGQNNTAV